MHLKQKQFNKTMPYLMPDVSRKTGVDYFIQNDRAENILKLIGKELKGSHAKQKAVLGATACGLAFDWGPGSEWLLGAVGVTANNALANSTDGWQIAGAAVMTGAITGAVSAAEQSGLGVLMAKGVRTFPQSFKYWNDTRKIKHDKADEVVKNKGSISTAVTLGSSAVVIEENLKNPERKFSDDVKVAIGASAIIGTFNAGLVAGVSAGVQVLDKYGAEGVANFVEQAAKNPLTYLGIFAVIKGYGHYKEAKKHKLYNSPLTSD
jgi:hypothetical protein